MSEIRLFELRQSVGFVKHAREALRVGDLSKAVRYAKMVTRGLYFTRGLAAGRGTGGTLGTAGLTSVLDNLWDAIDKALQPAPAVDAADLIPHLYNGLKILQAQGVEVEDEQLMERSRNLATVLWAHYRFTELPNFPLTAPVTQPGRN